uniref:Uncharacterized protein n=1 Tax=Podospora anserina (strain S / ATCC MYA-4624 / DSM 980 / FGSC 10383) TaxID=515849 RepID=A0A090CWZ2_PODAN|nr:Putative protein of unknown function [Podospora anserina S mat+]
MLSKSAQDQRKATALPPSSSNRTQLPCARLGVVQWTVNWCTHWAGRACLQMRWHAWKGSPCQRIFFHRAISSSFANRRARRLGVAHRNHDGGCRGGSRLSMGLSEDPCRPTSLASLPTYLPYLSSTWPVSCFCFSVLYSTIPLHGARSTFSHGPRLPSLKPCYLLQRGEAPSSARQLHLPKLQESRLENLAAVPPPPQPPHQGNATPLLPQALTRRRSSRQQAVRGEGYMALLPSVSCLSDPGFLTLFEKGPTLGTLRGLAERYPITSPITQCSPSGNWQTRLSHSTLVLRSPTPCSKDRATAELPLTLSSRPADLPVCLCSVSRSVCTYSTERIVQTAIHNTYSYSLEQLLVLVPPLAGVDVILAPLLACPALLCVRVAPFDLNLLQLLI